MKNIKKIFLASLLIGVLIFSFGFALDIKASEGDNDNDENDEEVDLSDCNVPCGWPTEITGISKGGNFGDPRHHREGNHEGVDIPNKTGTFIWSTASGVVVGYYADDGSYYGYGNYIDIRHSNEYWTRYAHLEEMEVQTNQKVVKNQIIGKMGETGYATGPHLHYEIHKAEYPTKNAVNPIPYMNYNNEEYNEKEKDHPALVCRSQPQECEKAPIEYGEYKEEDIMDEILRRLDEIIERVSSGKDLDTMMEELFGDSEKGEGGTLIVESMIDGNLVEGVPIQGIREVQNTPINISVSHSETAIAQMRAPSVFQGANFVRWEGCDKEAEFQCTVYLDTRESPVSKIVTVHYSALVPPPWLKDFWEEFFGPKEPEEPIIKKSCHELVGDDWFEIESAVCNSFFLGHDECVLVDGVCCCFDKEEPIIKKSCQELVGDDWFEVEGVCSAFFLGYDECVLVDGVCCCFDKEKDLTKLEQCKQDIKDAKEYAKGRICTQEVAKMDCQGILTYTATDGCQISFLKNRGWTRKIDKPVPVFDNKLYCLQRTTDTINVGYEYSDGTAVTLFMGNEQIGIFGHGDGAGMQPVFNLEPETSYDFYLRNGRQTNSPLLYEITCETKEDIDEDELDEDEKEELEDEMQKEIDEMRKDIKRLTELLGEIVRRLTDTDVPTTPTATPTTPTTPTSPTSGIPAVCQNLTFSRNLSVGSRGTDVRCLQSILNLSPRFQIASSGPGSPGNETEYFGPATRAAVIKFQEALADHVLTPYGLTSGTGYVGPSTISVLNQLLGR